MSEPQIFPARAGKSPALQCWKLSFLCSALLGFKHLQATSTLSCALKTKHVSQVRAVWIPPFVPPSISLLRRGSDSSHEVPTQGKAMNEGGGKNAENNGAAVPYLGVDGAGVATQGGDGISHGSQVDHRRHTSEILYTMAQDRTGTGTPHARARQATSSLPSQRALRILLLFSSVASFFCTVASRGALGKSSH